MIYCPCNHGKIPQMTRRFLERTGISFLCQIFKLEVAFVLEGYSRIGARSSGLFLFSAFFVFLFPFFSSSSDKRAHIPNMCTFVMCFFKYGDWENKRKQAYFNSALLKQRTGLAPLPTVLVPEPQPVLCKKPLPTPSVGVGCKGELCSFRSEPVWWGIRFSFRLSGAE